MPAGEPAREARRRRAVDPQRPRAGRGARGAPGGAIAHALASEASTRPAVAVEIELAAEALRPAHADVAFRRVGRDAQRAADPQAGDERVVAQPHRLGGCRAQREGTGPQPAAVRLEAGEDVLDRHEAALLAGVEGGE